MLRLLLCLLCLGARLCGQDFRPMVEEALRRGEKRIVIPPGNYRLGPRSGGELWALQGLRDVEIVATGVTLTGTRLMRALSIHRCSGLTLRGLTVDYDPLPFTQGTVITAASDAASVEIRLHAGYPPKAYPRVEVVDPVTRFRKKGMPFLWGAKTERVGRDLVRVSLPGIGHTARPGDLVSLSTGQETGAPHAIAMDQCERLLLEDVTLHSAPGMGLLEADGEGGSVFRRCRIVPGPKPAGASEERLLSSSWDAFQSKTIRRGPLVEDCVISHAGDDSWSVQSSDFLVLAADGSRLILASRDEHTAGVRQGDRLRAAVDGPEWRILSRRGLPRAQAKLAPEILAKLEAAKTWDLWHVSRQAIEVTLDRDFDLPPGTSVYSPDRMGNGFVFRNNRVHSSGRILLKAGGLMENNLLDTPHSLVVCPELPGAAAAGIEDLVIRGNTIRDAGWFCPAPWSSQAGVISITASADSKRLRETPVFRRIVLENNTVERGAGPHLVVSSARGLTVRGNRFLSPHHEKPPATGAEFGLPRDAVVWIGHASETVYEVNEIRNPGPFTGAKAEVR